MTVTGHMVIEKAMSHLGAREVPPGSNRGPFVQDCQEATGWAGTGWPWCAGFICRIAHEVGRTLPYTSGNAHDLADHYPAIEFKHAKPGDVFDWNEGSGHTSFMIEKTEYYVRTIDGNWGDEVAIATHPVSEIRRIWRIPGVDDAKPIKPRRIRRPRLWTVATSHRGHRVILFHKRSKKRLIRWLKRHTIQKIAPNGVTIKQHV